MKKISKILLSFALILILSAGSAVTAYATDNIETAPADTETSQTDSAETDSSTTTSSDAWPVAPELRSRAALVVDSSTGATIYSLDSERKIYPASTTKLLTCLIALENCSLDETITFSATAVALPEHSSSIDAVEGETMSLEDALYGMLLPSGNECANAVAEHVSGSIEEFANLMNEYVASLGCTNTHFTNPSGLYSSDHYSTAADMYLIAKAAFANSTLVDIASHANYTLPATNMSAERELSNSNYLIQSSSEYYNSSVVCGKTGYTNEGGRALVILSKQDNMTLISLFFDSPYYNGVFSDAQSMLDYVYNNFSLVNISQSEIRFSYSSDNARVEVDPTTALVIPNNLTLSDLDSQIVFASDMDAEEFESAKEAAGITTQDGRHLYATIEYSYNGNYIGMVYVLIDDAMTVSSSLFTEVYYINPLYAAIAIACVLILMFIMLKIAKSRAHASKRRAKLKIQRR